MAVSSLKFIKDRKIRVALTGYGRVAKNHIAAIQKYPNDLVLEALCDVNPENIKSVCEETGARLFTDYQELLADKKVDVVILCTPSGLHAKQTIMAAQAKKHVITEKPMATHFQDGLDMIRACDQEGVRLFVVKQNRYNDTLQQLKHAVENNRFGRMYMATLNVFWHRPQAYYNLAKWRGTWEFDGGALMNQASHYIDLLRWLLGPIDSVHAMLGTLARNIEAEDTGVINVRWRSGALGSVSVTNLVHKKDLEGSITLIGEKGTVRIGGIALNKVEHWSFEDKQSVDQEVFNTSYETESVYGFGHVPYYQNVIDVFRGDSEPQTDGREGLKALEILTAAYRSGRDHKEIGLPLVL